ncbi:transposable element Tcb2 transposase [Trichonephila clavipes]|nr:transposable element Tcb2 transposase [Trichonephila clavipes]
MGELENTLLFTPKVPSRKRRIRPGILPAFFVHVNGALVGPFLNGLPRAIFQQDNSRPHTARVAQDFLRHFQTLPWPARSPDLSSPVEHVWDQLKRQMSSCHSVHDFELAVQDLWAHLPQDNIRCLINSMPDRVAACIAAGGGPTRYGSCPVFVSLHTLYSFNCLVFEIK